MTTQAARAALRARQGAGARYDAAEAPAEDLLCARRGVSYFARLLAAVTDADLDAPSLCHGQSRRVLVARIGYEGRAMAEAFAALRAGADNPRIAAPEPARLALGASLPPRALRHLVHHAAIHLDVEWRDLPGPLWAAGISGADGALHPAHSLPLLRAGAVWRAALALGNGGRVADLPPVLRGGLREGILSD